MFVLKPDGSGASGGVGSSALQQKLWFFGKLGLYFGAIRFAFVYFSGRIEGGAATENGSDVGPSK